ncbi:hypothetical protein EW026_g443 [Hermanssonia centrifuga]|uniref:DNA replication checkpoint mediator MRC1 domain-containing protein n=1 Tax=Hermanssonia centrifuga TaxID=98765 RepID=A0A4V3XBM9_9APHY|nr:hypothetical protein EW026_g443 [Hermanssonia centrifuga]
MDSTEGIRRPARTYGRSRKPDPEPDVDNTLGTVDASFAQSDLADASFSSTNSSPTYSISARDYPPDSDASSVFDYSMTRDDDDNDDEAEADDAHEGEQEIRKSSSSSPGSSPAKDFKWDWRRELERLDKEAEQDDDDMEGAPRVGEVALGGEHGPSKSDRSTRLETHFSSVAAVPAVDNISADDPFDGPLSAPTSSSQPHQHLSSPLPITRRSARRVILKESDKESEDEQVVVLGANANEEARSSPQTSPDRLHHINTPPSATQSSPTPPTSQDMSSSRTKGKARAKQRKSTLRLSEDKEQDEDDESLPSGFRKNKETQGKSKGKGKEKATRVKPPTKKELLETQKATARIKADQQVAIPRTEKQLPLTALFAKFITAPSDSHPRQSQSNDPTTLSSDPIQSFSSSPMRTKTPPKRSLFTKPLLLLRHPPSSSNSRLRSKTVEQDDDVFGLKPAVLGTSNPSASYSTRPSHGKAVSQKEEDDDVFGFASNGLLDGTATSVLPGPSHAFAAASSDEDEDMPEVSTIIRENQEKRAREERQKHLRELKMRALEQSKQSASGNVSDSEDDGLEVVDDDMRVVAKEEEKDRRAMKAKHIRPSVGRKNQLIYAGRSPHKKKAEGKQDFQALIIAAAPSFSAQAQAQADKDKRHGVAPTRVGKTALNRILLMASEKQSKELTRQKEQEFYKRGGPSRDALRETDEGEKESLKRERLRMLAEKGLEAAQRREYGEQSEGEEEGDSGDDDWAPQGEVGSEDESDSQGGKENVAMTEDDQPENEVPVATEDEDENEDKENVYHKPRRTLATRAFRPAVVDSDEDEENQGPLTSTQRFGRVLVPDTSLIIGSSSQGESEPVLNDRHSVSSLEERTEDGTDKENDAGWMFDRGEDKENTAVASQYVSPSGRMPLRRGMSGSLFSLDSSLGLIGSPSSLRDAEVTLLEDERTPFKEIITAKEDEDEEGFFLSPSSRPVRSIFTLSKHSTPAGPSRVLTPLPLSSPGGKGLDEFFSDDGAAEEGGKNAEDELCGLEPAADIRPAFAQLFDDKTQSVSQLSALPQKLKAAGFSQFFTPEKSGSALQKLRPPQSSKDLSLTMDAQIQPALDVDETLLRKADDIFEKEQEFLLEDAVKAPPSQRSVYVNETGFLTQTRPSSSRKDRWALDTSPFFSESSPALQGLRSMMSTQRRPLGTLALSPIANRDADEDEDEAEVPRMGRLRKRRSTPELGKGKSGGYRSSASPSPPRRNIFEVLGRPPARAKVLQASKKKLEKSAFIEGEAEESDEDDGLAFGVRKKKDDDEEELDGEDQDGILEELVNDTAMDVETLNEAKVLEKVQEHRALDDAADEKLARDAAEGKYDATKAFVQAYHAELEDDNEEFAHLENDDFSLTFVDRENDRIDEEQDEDNENDEPEVVSAMQLQEELRKVARGEATVKTINPEDVSWMDPDNDMDDEGEDILVKEIATSRKPGRSAQTNQMDWDMIQKPQSGESTQDIARQQKWARTEGGSRNAGTGRASAVTGIGKSSKTGGGSVTATRKGPTPSGESSQARSGKQGARLSKAPSALSAVSSRRAKFTN